MDETEPLIRGKTGTNTNETDHTNRDTDTSETDPTNRDTNTSETDPTNRDPKQIGKDVVTVDFEDVIAEPAGVHTPDCVWKCSYNTFTESKKLCYCCLATICSVPLSLLWGLLFASMPFCQIWVTGPCVNLGSKCIGRPCLRFRQIFCDPLCRALGKTCSTMKGLIRKEA